MFTTPSPNDFLQAAANLGPQTLDTLVAHYHPQARFQDPFQTVTGRDAIAAVYRGMFANLIEPRFTDLAVAVVPATATATATATANENALGSPGPCWAVRWVFRFRVKPGAPEQAIAGTSWLWLCPETGLIQDHQDHWDASELFAAFPALGWAVRGLKKRISASGHVTEKT
jgi:ketosteroid isomerase-like protein